MKLPIDAILSTKNPRTILGSLDTLMASLADEGQLQPIGVRTMPEPDALGHRYSVVYGHRRLAAVRELRARATDDVGRARWSVIDALMRDDIDPRSDSDASVHENTVRERLALVDLYAQIMLRRRQDGSDAPTIARQLGILPNVAEACIIIHEQVAPDLTDKLRLDARGETVHRLLMASKIRGRTLAERHERQRIWWANEGWKDRAGPRSPKIGNSKAKRASKAALTRAADTIESTRRIRDADGSWIALEPAVASALARALRWALRPAEHKPPV